MTFKDLYRIYNALHLRAEISKTVSNKAAFVFIPIKSQSAISLID